MGIERLRQGEPAIGTFTRTGRPDLDFAVIDAQYGRFDINAIRQAVVAMREWLDENARDKRAPHAYTLEEFGYTEAGLAADFAEYRARHILRSAGVTE